MTRTFLFCENFMAFQKYIQGLKKKVKLLKPQYLDGLQSPPEQMMPATRGLVALIHNCSHVPAPSFF